MAIAERQEASTIATDTRYDFDAFSLRSCIILYVLPPLVLISFRPSRFPFDSPRCSAGLSQARIPSAALFLPVYLSGPDFIIPFRYLFVHSFFCRTNQMPLTLTNCSKLILVLTFPSRLPCGVKLCPPSGNQWYVRMVVALVTVVSEDPKVLGSRSRSNAFSH